MVNPIQPTDILPEGQFIELQQLQNTVKVETHHQPIDEPEFWVTYIVLSRRVVLELVMKNSIGLIMDGRRP